MEINSFHNLYANTYITNFFLVILITALTVALSLAMPAIDGMICGRLGLSLWGGISKNPRAEKLLRIRKGILYALFALYVVSVIGLVFITRPAHEEYLVNNSITNFTDLRLIDFLFPRTELIEFYLNTMLFIPMGYLLPYLFRWFRMRPVRRPLLACFLISLLIENVQLLTRRGYYDTSDILGNTLGGLFGILLFLLRAYRLTDPEWKQNRKRYQLWKKRAKEGTLYPFGMRLRISRVTLLATDEEEIFRFYVETLGLRLRRQLVPEDSPETAFLLAAGRDQIEIRCLNREEKLPEQYLTISFENLDSVRRRLLDRGIDPGDYREDPYTRRRTLRFSAPDSVRITLMEN